MSDAFYCMGLDAGTTGIKAVVFDPDGNAIGTGLAEYTLETPRPDIVELEPEIYWQAARDAIALAVSRAGADPTRIRSLGITGQAETLIMTDEAGHPVRKAIVWLDNRGKEEARLLEEKFGSENLFRMSGQTEMLPCWPAAKILWYRKNQPELFRKTAKFLMVEDFLLHRLTGSWGTCRGLMPSSLYFDIRTGKYEPAMLDFLQIKQDQLPPPRAPGEKAGICKNGNGTILPAGVLVSVAPIDHVCGNLGSGCAREGTVSETTGCTMALCAVSDHVLYDDARRISTYCGCLPGSFVLLPWAPTAGMLLKHFRDEFASGMSYADFDAAAASVPPGSEGLLILPHAAGAVSPVCCPEARAAAYGITLAHKRGHWARAIMESVAYLLRDNVEVLRTLGCRIDAVRALGGAAKSPLWLQIMADVLALPITLTSCEEATSLGAAILGAAAAGLVPDAVAGAEKMVRTCRTIHPGKDAEIYRKYFRDYQKLNQLLMPTFGGKL